MLITELLFPGDNTPGALNVDRKKPSAGTVETYKGRDNDVQREEGGNVTSDRNHTVFRKQFVY